MKAVILAGGEGTRLQPLTLVTNKHLLPLYDRPVISYAVEKLRAAGIEDIMIISSPQYIESFKRLIGTGKDGRIKYAVQHEPKGIAHGLHIAKDHIGDDHCLLWLGDGIVEDDIVSHIKNFKKGAKVFLKKVKDPERFGVATVDKKMRVKEIIEKPANPKSDFAVVGVYMYDNSVFDKMINQPVSARGEYEITYINNRYVDEGSLEAVILKKPWFDIGSIESLFEASHYMKKKAVKAKSKKKK